MPPLEEKCRRWRNSRLLLLRIWGLRGRCCSEERERGHCCSEERERCHHSRGEEEAPPSQGRGRCAKLGEGEAGEGEGEREASAVGRGRGRSGLRREGGASDGLVRWAKAGDLGFLV